MNKTIIHEWDFPYPVEKVWEYLTNPDLLAQWLMPNDFKAEVGHHFTFQTKPKVKFGFDGTIYCEVKEMEKPHKLSYTWQGGSNGKISLDSLVMWTLKPTNEGTRLRLEHSGFSGWRNYLPYLIMGKGWEINVNRKLLKLIQEHAYENQH